MTNPINQRFGPDRLVEITGEELARIFIEIENDPELVADFQDYRVKRDLANASEEAEAFVELPDGLNKLRAIVDQCSACDGASMLAAKVLMRYLDRRFD